MAEDLGLTLYAWHDAGSGWEPQRRTEGCRYDISFLERQGADWRVTVGGLVTGFVCASSGDLKISSFTTLDNEAIGVSIANIPPLGLGSEVER